MLFALLIAAAATAAPADWTVLKKTDGITVSKRDVAGSPVVAFRGEGDVEASLLTVSTVIFDTTRAPEWIKDLKSSKIVRWTGSDEFIEYDHVGTPPGLSDRDFLSTVKLEADPQAHVVRFHYQSVVDAAVPPTKKYVRGDLMSTVFTLTRIDDTHTHVIAEIHCDPKGYIPKWVVNWVQADWPEATFRGLRRQVKKPDVKPEPWFEQALAP